MSHIIVKTEKGEFKYTKWQWNLAWFIAWLAGVIVGITCF
jgi:cytosine/uracil/thiamine/allantoin permease